MKRCLFFSLSLAAIIFALDTSDADARGFWGRSSRSYSHRSTSNWGNSSWGQSSSYHYSRARHIDGRTHWDMGKQQGSWPSNL